ncbi:MAG: hypothetical protein U1E36_05135 [Rickettsiales bacterium]
MPRLPVSLPRSLVTRIALGLTGCASPPEEYDLSPPSFVDQAPIALDVAGSASIEFNPPVGGSAEKLFPASAKLPVFGQSRAPEGWP